MNLQFTTIAVALVTFSTPSARASEADQLAADRCRDLLESSVIDFYLPGCVDEQHGGFFEVLDENGSFGPSEKFLTLQARQTWFFSTLAVSDIRKKDALKAAESGYQFLREHFYDSNNGGYFAKTTREGQPSDRRKHVYPNAFVIYAFVEYHRATGLAEPLEKAMELFHTLENNCYDTDNGGYKEFFTDDWQLITDPSQSGYVGTPNTKTYNSHLHLLEAFTPLLLETGNALVRERLSELVQINTLTVKHPDHACNIDGWHLDWKMIDSPRNLRASYGHDVECSWLVLDASRAMGRKDNALRTWAQTICNHAIRFGRDRTNGGFFYTGPLGNVSDDRKKVWWTQSEVLVAMLTMENLTGESKYRTIFDETLDFVGKHHIAVSGGWWAEVNEDGSVGPSKSRTSMWHGAYHNGRALLLCEKLLRAME